MPSDALKNVLARLKAECNKGRKARAALQVGLTEDEARARLVTRVAREFLLRKEVDAACRVWMKTGLWPKPEFPDTVLHFWDRLLEAMMLAGWLRKCGFSSEKAEDDLLQLLLIDCWEVIGLQRLKGRLQNWPG